MAKPDITECPECNATIHYLAKGNEITCPICSELIEVEPSIITEDEPVQSPEQITPVPLESRIEALEATLLMILS